MSESTSFMREGYVGNGRLDAQIIFTSLIALFGTFATLFFLVEEQWFWLAIIGVITILGWVFSVRLQGREIEQAKRWIKTTYDLDLRSGELQQLKEGKAIQRGNVWWIRVNEFRTIGLVLQRTEAVPFSH